MTSPIWVLYHADCLDGWGAAWSAWRALGDTAHYLPVRHSEPLPDIPKGVTLYILDFCYPPDILVHAATIAHTVMVLDHHVSSQSAFEAFIQRVDCEVPTNLQVHFDLNHSGCVLAWQYFHNDALVPQLLQHIEDHDLWHHRLPGTAEIIQALYLRLPIPFKHVNRLKLTQLQREGGILLKQYRKSIQRLLQSRHPVTLHEIQGLAVNAPSQFSSELGMELAKRSGTFGLTYHYHGQRKRWECGLRSIGDFNVAELAVHYGGGGHPNAAGFTLNANSTPWSMA